VKVAAFLFLACASLAFANEVPGTPETLTLAQAESVALRHAPAIGAAFFRSEAARQAVLEARSAFFPQVTAEFSAVGTGNDMGNFFGGTSHVAKDTRLGATGGLNDPTILSRESNGIVISQLISDFGQTANLTSMARYRARSEAEKAKVVKSVALYQVDKIYFKALEAEALLAVSKETASARRIVFDQVKAMVDSNLKSGLDLSFARVSVGEAELLIVQAQNALDEAEAELSAALGCRLPHRFVLIDEPQYPLPNSTPGELAAQALKYRPEAIGLRNEYAATARYSAAERAARYPKITAMGSMGRTPVGDPRVEGNYEAVGINVELPLFTGGRLSAQVQEAVSKQSAAQKTLEEEEERIVKDVNIAWLDALAGLKKIKVTEEILGSSQEALELADSRFRLGSTSIVELTQAQLANTQAKLAHTGAKYEYQMNRVKLEFETGALKFRTPLRGTH